MNSRLDAIPLHDIYEMCSCFFYIFQLQVHEKSTKYWKYQQGARNAAHSTAVGLPVGGSTTRGLRQRHLLRAVHRHAADVSVVRHLSPRYDLVYGRQNVLK